MCKWLFLEALQNSFLEDFDLGANSGLNYTQCQYSVVGMEKGRPCPGQLSAVN